MSTGDPAGLMHEADDAGRRRRRGRPASRRSPRARRCSCSGAGCAATRSRWSRSASSSLLIVVAVFAPLIVSIAGTPGPARRRARRRSTCSARPTGPSAEHPFGVDRLGRDVFSRTVYGARVSLEVALIATGIAVFIGTIVGLLAGFYRGWIDTLLSRLTDVVLAFPILLLGLGLAAACSGADGCFSGLIQPGLPVVIMVIAIINWTYIARIVRGQVLSLREKEFVEAARSLGASDRRIIVREILPNLVAPLIVYASLLIPANILLEAALSFLGVGVARRHAVVGRDDRRGHQPVPRRLVVHALPGPRAALHRARLQPRGRRAAGRPRPAPAVRLDAPLALEVHTPTKGRTSMSRSLWRTLLALAALVAVLGLGACGGDDDESSDERRHARADRGRRRRQRHRAALRRHARRDNRAEPGRAARRAAS